MSDVSQVISMIREAAAAMRVASGRAGLPLDKTLWDAADCALWLKVSKRTFERVRSKAGFPKARYPGDSARWIASEIIDWAGEQ
jgi:predicted DNA-binding transcriptional regulator AlpA